MTAIDKIPFLGITQTTGTRAVSGPNGEYGGGESSGAIAEVNLNNKHGITNQFAILPGGVSTYTARNLDLLD
ncbi:MAG: hypothetical protein E7Z89_04035 [Cyanobacteria bacterium SIG28]|nr:hypothetical protein [Cyanobacteria bacterium SIG28]